MRVLHIVDVLDDPRWWAEAITCLEAEGVTNSLGVLSGLTPSDSWTPTGQDYEEDGGAGRLGPRSWAWLRRMLREGTPDLVHLHGPASGLLGAVAARAAPRVLHRRHGVARGRTRWSYRLAGRGVAGVIASSRVAAGDAYVADRVPEDRIHVVFDGGRRLEEPTTHDRAAVDGVIKERLAVDDLVLVLAAASESAGVHTLSRAIPIAQSLVGRRLGVALFEERLERRIEQLSPDLWWVSDDRLSAWLAASAVVVDPASTGPPARHLLSVPAAGRPLIVGRGAEFDDIVRHGSTGIRVEMRNSRLLAFAIAAALRDPVRAARFGRRAQAHAHAALDMQKMARAWANIYRSCLVESHQL